MPNPYSITPAGDMSQGLAGLSAVLKDVGEQRQMKEAQAAKEARMQEGADALRTAYQSGDPTAIMQVSIDYPELAANAKMLSEQQTGIKDAERKEFMFSLYANPESANQLYQQRIQMIQARGGDPSDTIAAYQQFAQDPQAKIEENNRMLPFLYSDDWKAYQDSIAQEKVTPYTDVGKLETDFRNGVISPEQYAEARNGMSSSGGVDQRERRINDYMKYYGLSKEEAIKRVDADVRVDTNGNVIEVDPITGTASILDINVGEAPERMPDPQTTQVEDIKFDVSKGTGFAAALKGVWNATGAQVPFFRPFQDVETSAQNLRILERDAINALASSSRPPVVEQNRIANIIPKPMDWTENPQVAEWKMTNFVDLMMQQYIDDERYKGDLRNPKALRDEASDRSNRIESIMSRVLTPEARSTMFDALGEVEADTEDIRGMDYQELITLDPSGLSDNQLDIYIERLGAGQ